MQHYLTRLMTAAVAQHGQLSNHTHRDAHAHSIGIICSSETMCTGPTLQLLQMQWIDRHSCWKAFPHKSYRYADVTVAVASDTLQAA